MKKLYFKIFVTFILVFLVALFLIIGLFSLYLDRGRFSHYERLARVQSMMIREVIRARSPDLSSRNLRRNGRLKKTLTHLAKMQKVTFWIRERSGRIIMSNEKNPPPLLSKIMRRDIGDIRIYHTKNLRRGPIVFVIPIGLRAGGQHELIVRPEPRKRGLGELSFLLGLPLIGLVIALLLLPLARRITGPLTELRESARKMADGKFDDRVMIRGEDEIAELGWMFNRLAERIELMLKSHRELTANVSHELRSPLSRMRIIQELLREDMNAGRETNVSRLDALEGEIEVMDRLLGDILRFSRLDLQDKIDGEVFDARELLFEVLASFEQSLEHGGLKLRIEDRNLPLPVYGDPELTRIAFSNALDNAVRYSPSGGELRITLDRSEDPNRQRIVFGNRTDLQSPVDIERLFVPFYRGEEKNGEGFGLGLALVKKILEKQGGAVHLKLEKGWFELIQEFKPAE